MLTEKGIISTETKAVTDYAVNGAYFYAKHIAQNSSFKKIIAIGVSGDEKHHRITPLYVDDRKSYQMLPDVESFTMFTKDNIQEYYVRNVLALLIACTHETMFFRLSGLAITLFNRGFPPRCWTK